MVRSATQFIPLRVEKRGDEAPMQHVRAGLVTVLVVAMLFAPSWPLVTALAVVSALAALDFWVERAKLLDAADRKTVLDAAASAKDAGERLERLETQVRFLNGRPNGAIR